jgi:hypothetical protein
MHYESTISSCNSFGATSPGMESIRWRSFSLCKAASSAYRSLLSWHHITTRRKSAEGLQFYTEHTQIIYRASLKARLYKKDLKWKALLICCCGLIDVD